MSCVSPEVIVVDAFLKVMAFVSSELFAAGDVARADTRVSLL